MNTNENLFLEKEVTHLSGLLNLSSERIKKALLLNIDGCTLPFIARYRKEATKGLDEEELRSIFSAHESWVKLSERKEAIIGLLETKNVLSDRLLKSINSTETSAELESLYKPYKTKKQTRAEIARKAGLTELKEFVMKNKYKSPISDYYSDLFPTEEKVWEGVFDIIAEEISLSLQIYKSILEMYKKYSRLEVEKTKKEDEKNIYTRYYNFSQLLNRIKPYQTMAIFRGEKEKLLNVTFKQPMYLEEKVKQNFTKFDQSHKYFDSLNLAIQDSLKRLIIPRVERELHSNLKELAESRSMFVFGRNVHYLLLQKPMGSISILGIDPGYRTGSKWALISSNGDLQKVGVLFHTPPHLKIEEAKEILSNIYSNYRPKLITIGNGSGSYETAKFVSDWIKETKNQIKFRIISEAGASIYSASENARKEFPNIDVTYRGAVSIARRVQNPLSELIKTPPESLGVGMYQHDLAENKLHVYLDQEVSIAINQVGVNINTSSVNLLQHISGLSSKLAERIVEYRSQIKSFSNRKQLLEVKGLGKKTFEQCAGFCRIPNGENPFDNTTIHPESYKIADKLLKDADSSRMEFKEKPDFSRNKLIGFPVYAWSSKNEVPLTLSKDIIKSLLQNSDLRKLLEDPVLYSNCLSFDDLYEGMELKGTTSSITDFGIFIDIGIKYSGFSPLPKTSVADVYKKYPIGSPVDIIVTSLDKERKRIQVKFKNTM